MRSEALYLADIVEAADAIERFLKGVSKDSFEDDDLVSSAVLQKLGIIGEATSRLSHTVRDRYPHIEWRKIVAFRNIVIHAYFSVNVEIAWKTAISDVPELRRNVLAILEQDYPSGSQPGAR